MNNIAEESSDKTLTLTNNAVQLFIIQSNSCIIHTLKHNHFKI